MSARARNIVVVTVVVVSMALITLLTYNASSNASESAGAVHDLSSILSRRSPLTEYTNAWYAHTDCRKNHEDQFLGAIGRTINDQLPPEVRLQARMDAIAAGAELDHIEDFCPTPQPPEFDDDGNLVKDPVIPTTTTTTKPGG